MSFDKKVWNLTRRIPPGRVTTYGLIAKKLGTKAYRAVGNALNRNRDKRVPCHRVVKSTGEVGGFAGGTKEKTRMLRKEGVRVKRWAKEDRIDGLESFLFRL
ncbi:MAG: MGMT family protein [Candidatus Woesearchaeota archaeon]